MTYDIRHILVPLDMSSSGAASLQYAAHFSCRLLAPVTVMYADPIIYPADILPAEAVALMATPEFDARLHQEIRDFARVSMRDWPFDVDIRYGPPVPAILRAAREDDARLIVMGSHLHRGWRSALTGSVISDVIHGASCPVMTVGGRLNEDKPHITRVLCPVNFTDVARQSLRFASMLADLFAAELLVVHVVEPGQPLIAESRVREWIEPEMRESAKYREIIMRGGPAERVLDCAEDLGADLLVIGAQHKMFRDATVIGSTTERLIRFADCPVITFPVTVMRAKTVAVEDAFAMRV